jgi:hypothetical protein
MRKRATKRDSDSSELQLPIYPHMAAGERNLMGVLTLKQNTSFECSQAGRAIGGNWTGARNKTF